jgi:hypothetical protein
MLKEIKVTPTQCCTLPLAMRNKAIPSPTEFNKITQDFRSRKKLAISTQWEMAREILSAGTIWEPGQLDLYSYVVDSNIDLHCFGRSSLSMELSVSADMKHEW